jgi:hypothetical protein
MIILPAESCCDVCLEEYNEERMRLPHTMPCGPPLFRRSSSRLTNQLGVRPSHLHIVCARLGGRCRGDETMPILSRNILLRGRTRRANRLSTRNCGREIYGKRGYARWRSIFVKVRIGCAHAGSRRQRRSAPGLVRRMLRTDSRNTLCDALR